MREKGRGKWGMLKENREREMGDAGEIEKLWGK